MNEPDHDIAKVKAIYDELKAKGWAGTTGHDYFGPACMHGRHALCSFTCPYCTSPCRCACHASGLTR